MRIVVDTNIAFSALLNTNSKIARIILQPKTSLNFYSTERLLFEINQHREKIKSFTDYTNEELERMISIIANRIRFVNVRFIPNSIYEKSEILTKDIDIDDCEFIALTDHIKGSLRSGDKKLMKGLMKKNWEHFIDTDNLYNLISKK